MYMGQRLALVVTIINLLRYFSDYGVYLESFSGVSKKWRLEVWLRDGIAIVLSH